MLQGSGLEAWGGQARRDELERGFGESLGFVRAVGRAVWAKSKG